MPSRAVGGRGHELAVALGVRVSVTRGTRLLNVDVVVVITLIVVATSRIATVSSRPTAGRRNVAPTRCAVLLWAAAVAVQIPRIAGESAVARTAVKVEQGTAERRIVRNVIPWHTTTSTIEYVGSAEARAVYLVAVLRCTGLVARSGLCRRRPRLCCRWRRWLRRGRRQRCGRLSCRRAGWIALRQASAVHEGVADVR